MKPARFKAETMIFASNNYVFMLKGEMLRFSIEIFVSFDFECLEKVQMYGSKGFRGKGWDL